MTTHPNPAPVPNQPPDDQTLAPAQNWIVRGNNRTVQRFSRDRRDEVVAHALADALRSLHRRDGDQRRESSLRRRIKRLEHALRRRRPNTTQRRRPRPRRDNSRRIINADFRRLR